MKRATIVPNYRKHFICVGAKKCLTSCCHEQLFFIDKDDFDKVRAIPDKEVSTSVLLAFPLLNEGAAVEQHAFSRMNPHTGKCWMLTPQGDCILYKDGLLPSRCRTYPAINSHFLESDQSFLSPSCPEVTKLLWQRDDAMLLEIAELDTSDQSRLFPDIPLPLQERYLLIREFGAMLLQTHELPLSLRLMILFFTMEQVRAAYERNDVEKVSQTLEDVKQLVIAGDPALTFDNVQFNHELHAVLLIKLLQIRHDRQQGVTAYEHLLNEVVFAFDLTDQSISLEERALKAAPKIVEALQDLEQALVASPYFLDKVLLNHWLAYAFPAASNDGLRVNILAFILFFLLQRFFLAATAMSTANNFEQQASLNISAFHREWVDNSPMLFAAAMSMADSELKNLPNVFSLLAMPKK